MPAPVKPRRVDGVDLSHHQPRSMDFKAGAAAGVKWASLKATEGQTVTDDDYEHFRAAAKAAGIVPGAYSFARPEAVRGPAADAVRECRHFLATAKPQPGELRPTLDLEVRDDPDVNDTPELREWARQWIAECERQLGVKPMVYTPYDLGDVLDGCIVWRPRYNDQNEPPVLPWDIWQFSNGVLGVPDHVAGFGHVDLNTMRAGLDLDDLIIPKRRRRKPRWFGEIVAEYYNVGDGPVADKKRDLDRAVAKGAVLILLAECSDRVEMLKAWARANGWTYTDGDGSPGAPATPALIRNDLMRCVDHVTTTEAVPATRVGAPGAGPVMLKRKVVQKIRIRRRWRLGIPRRAVRILWGHYLPSAERKQLANHELREDLHLQHTAAVLKATGHEKPLWIAPLTLVVHDFNCEWDSPLMEPYRAAGFHALETGPTHEKRTIDIWLVKAGRGKRAARRIRRWIVACFTAPGSSDHNAVVVEIP